MKTNHSYCPRHFNAQYLFSFETFKSLYSIFWRFKKQKNKTTIWKDYKIIIKRPLIGFNNQLYTWTFIHPNASASPCDLTSGSDRGYHLTSTPTPSTFLRPLRPILHSSKIPPEHSLHCSIFYILNFTCDLFLP